MKEKNSMRIRVVIEFDKEAQSFSAVCPELPGCTSCGDTEEEAMKTYENVKEAYNSIYPAQSSVTPLYVRAENPYIVDKKGEGFGDITHHLRKAQQGEVDIDAGSYVVRRVNGRMHYTAQICGVP